MNPSITVFVLKRLRLLTSPLGDPMLKIRAAEALANGSYTWQDSDIGSGRWKWLKQQVYVCCLGNGAFRVYRPTDKNFLYTEPGLATHNHTHDLYFYMLWKNSPVMFRFSRRRDIRQLERIHRSRCRTGVPILHYITCHLADAFIQSDLQ